MKEVLLTSTALILALLVLRKLFQKTVSRRVQYALWGLVLLRLLVPVSLPAAEFSVLSVSQPVREQLEEQIEGPMYVLPVEETPILPQSFPQEERGQIVGTSSAGYTILAEDGASLTTYAMTTAEAIALVWKFGIAVMTCWLIFSNLRLWFLLRKHRVPYPVEDCHRRVYLVAEGLPSPCLFGILRPAIYLTPAAADPNALRYVLAHEETHARHLDPLWSLLRGVCLAVYWFDPLVWWAALASRTDCELACDEGALSRLGEDERLAYGRVLLSLIPVRRRPGDPMLAATTMTSGKKRLKERIIRIAENRRTVTAALCAVTLLAALVCAVTFTGGRERPLEQEQQTKAPVSASIPEGEPELWIPLTDLEHYTAYELDAVGLAQFLKDRPGEMYRADYNGDGAEEVLCVTERTVYYYFQRDGVLYQVDICDVLAAVWRDRWAASKMRFTGLELPEDSRSATIHLKLPVPGTAWDPLKCGLDASRYLVFDGENLLVYQTEPKTVGHILDSVDAPADVIADAEVLGESGSQYHHNKYRQYDVWDDNTDWRIVDVQQVVFPEISRLDVAAEVYSIEYEICGDTSVILAANDDITLKEGGWAGGFVNSKGWLIYQMVDGRRILLDSMMYGYPDYDTSKDLADWCFVALKRNGLVAWPAGSAMEAYGEVMGTGDLPGEFVDAMTGERLTLSEVGRSATNDKRLWNELRAYRFAVIDLDRDGTPEVVLSIGFYSNGEYYETGSEILHYENGTVYGYNLWNSTFSQLKEDGTFYYSNLFYDPELKENVYDASLMGWSGYASLRFSEGGYEIDEFMYDDVVDFEITYYVNGETTTEEEYYLAVEVQDNKSEPYWFEYNFDTIRAMFGS